MALQFHSLLLFGCSLL
ncbi:hypothetical protein Avbf_18265 [Armadillidium vulgare]|nr:hypothetical protein Avbf_18265 [Armadillidium vulgare]